MRWRCAARWAVVMALLLMAVAVSADVGDYLGKPVASVTIRSDGNTLTDLQLVQLIETRVGQPLTLSDVRVSIAHLFSGGRFEDIRVHAEAAGSGVSLIYELVALPVVTGVAFVGLDRVSGVEEKDLRRMVGERFGARPRVSRSPEIALAIEAALRDAGYLSARVAQRTDVTGQRVTLSFAIEAGERAYIRSIDVVGASGLPVAEFLDTLGLAVGGPFRREALNARLDRYLAERRRRGFFSARVSVSPTLSEEKQRVALTLTVSQGPHVRLAFKGDPLPSDRWAELAPVEREGSADEDLLEDSRNRIQEYLRAQGYREAAAPYSRAESDGELLITFTVSRGPQYRVGAITVEGNRFISLAALQSLLRIRPGQPFSAAALDRDLASIEEAYRREGFAAVQVVPAIEPQPVAAGANAVPVAIRVTVTENVRTVVNALSIEGSQALSEADLRQDLGLQPGRPFFLTQLAVDRDAVQLRYANSGYQSASVDARPGISADGTAADVVLTVREGPQTLVEHVLIAGNERTRTATIERELRFKPGDPLGLEAINESQRRLAALGLFRRVRITALGHGDASKRDVLVTVEESLLTTVGYGGGFEVGRRLAPSADAPDVAVERLEFAPRASFEIGRRNLFGTNRSVNVFASASLHPGNTSSAPEMSTAMSGEFSLAEYRVLGQFNEPRAFGTSADLRVTGALERQRRSSFDFSRRSVNAELARRVARNISVSGGYQIQRTLVFDVTSQQRLIDRIFPNVRLSSFSTAVIRDTRDDPFGPLQGQYLSANGQVAARLIGSEVGFAKSFFTAQMFRTLPRTRALVFAGSARVGLATGFGQELLKDLPASERFYSGGDTTVRGFALDQLGVRHIPAQAPVDTIDSGGFPLGGNGLVILNGELRVPVRGEFGIVGFLDAGNVFKRVTDISLGALRPAVGFGIRYKSPVGPIRLDLGFKVNRRDYESLKAWFITFGQAY